MTRTHVVARRAGLLAAGALILAACRGGQATPGPATTPSGTSEASAGTGSQARPVPTLPDEKAALAEVDASWPTEKYLGESGAARKVILDALARHKPIEEGALAAFAPTFAGEPLAGRPTDSLGEPSGIALAAWRELPAELDAPAFVASFNDYLAEFAQISATEVHTWEAQIPEGLPDDQLGLEAKDAVWVVGTTPDGQVREDRLYLVFDLRRPKDTEAKDWRIVGLRTENGRTAQAPKSYFTDVTDAVLPGGYDQVGAAIYTDGGPALADVDADGDPDLFLPRQHAAAKLYLNDGSGKFSDATVDWGLQTPELASGSNSGVLFDYDRDGRLDLLVGLKDSGARLFHNEGGYFQDVSGAFNLLGPGQWQTLAVADYDGDGYPDVYATNYNLIDTEHQPESYVDARDGLPNVLLKNEGGSGKFTDVTAAAGLDVDNRRWSYVAAWADYDQDQDMDLYVVNDYGPSQLFRNKGDGSFEEVSAAVGAQDKGNGMGGSWADYDGDGDLDLFKANMQSFAGNRITRLTHFPGTEEQRAIYRRFSQGNTLLRNKGDGSFEDATDEAGVRDGFFAWATNSLDYDSDGDLDLLNNAGFYTGNSTADT
jgi:hypothetical protein